MYQKKRLSLAVTAALGLSSFLIVPSQALAQDQQSEDESEDLLVEEVIVTGSRIVRDDGFGRTSPVTVVGMEDISSYGLTRIEDVLNNLPQIETAQNAMISNGSSGAASIDLRGLGTNRTLVLVNGRRMQPGGIKQYAADVNQIPAAMIERVEVLTGGASATYGADAVAGVVNFVMRRMDGVEVSVGASAYQHDNSNGYMQGLMDEKGYEYPTGNTGIDAVLQVARKLESGGIEIPESVELDPRKRLVLVTAHRRENQGEPMRQICRALLRLVDEFSDLRVVYPVHLTETQSRLQVSHVVLVSRFEDLVEPGSPLGVSLPGPAAHAMQAQSSHSLHEFAPWRGEHASLARCHMLDRM